VTPAAYLITPAGNPPARAHPGPGLRNVAPHQSATWYFASILPVTSVSIPVEAAPGSQGRGIRVGLVRPSGSVDWIATTPGPGGGLDASLGHPQPAVAVRVAAGSGRAGLGPPVTRTTGGGAYRADGQLQDALVPPRWRFSGFDGAFAVFTDSMAKPALTLQAPPHGLAAGALIRAVGGPGFAPTSAYVSSAHGVTVVRAVADIAGWAATWQPAGTGTAQALPVHRSGLVQAVTVPAGRGTITWRYDPPAARLGLWVSLIALAVLMGVSSAAASSRRRRGRDEPPRPDRHPPSLAGNQLAGPPAMRTR
jgi:hypothetical protein